MKKPICIILLAFLLFAMCACTPTEVPVHSDTPSSDPGEPSATSSEPTESSLLPTTPDKITMPDVTDTEEDIAKTILTNNGLIPTTQYEHSDTVTAGTIIRTEPAMGEKVEPNTKVTLYVSLGPSQIYCKNAIINWYYAKDEWQLYKPYLENGYLYIDCDVAFADDMKWAGYAIGGLDIGFQPSVPVTVYYEKESCSAYQTQQVLFKVPVSSLGVEKPSTVYLRLYMIIDGKEIYADIDLSIEW